MIWRTRILLAAAVVAGLGLAVLAALFWLGYREPAQTASWPSGAAPVASSDQARIEQGRYLAALGNCMGCHTRQAGEPYAGGREIPTPFGRFVGPNLTPDPEYGIGKWTADEFWRALHHGKRPDGSLLYPAFPYTSYQHLTREDADALYSYLQSLPPVKRPNDPHRLDFPYDQRPLIALWRALYFDRDPEPAAPRDESGDAQWLRGRYLVEGLAHCAECHTARDSLGGWEGQPLAGGLILGMNWYAPPLTSDAAGLGSWTAQEIADYLRTGLAAHSYASGPMAESVRNGFQFASPDDALAMGMYLKQLPAAGLDTTPERTSLDYGVMESGRKVYATYCAQCHQAEGSGVKGAWPALAANPSVNAASPVNAIQLVLAGGFAPATQHHDRPHGMPPFAHVLSDSDVAAVVTYIRNSWGNKAGPATLPQVRAVRQAP